MIAGRGRVLHVADDVIEAGRRAAGEHVLPERLTGGGARAELHDLEASEEPRLHRACDKEVVLASHVHALNALAVLEPVTGRGRPDAAAGSAAGVGQNIRGIDREPARQIAYRI